MRKILIIICLLFTALSISLAQDETPTPYEVALERILGAEKTGAMLLDLSWLGLDELPPEISNLSNLQILVLVGNKLSYLPPELFHLDQLVWLSLSDNLLTDLPPEIKGLTDLEVLTIDYNQLQVLPPEIGELTELRDLLLSNNQLKELPPEIGNLSNLCRMFIKNNQIRELPHELGKLTKLDHVDRCDDYGWVGFQIDGNPLISPPLEVIAEGTPAILDYLNHEAEWHLQRLIVSGTTGIGLLVALILGLGWRMRRKTRKSKQKRNLA